MAPLAIPLVLAGTGISAFGTYQQGKAAEAQGKSEQEALNYNAALKDREAKLQLERARTEAGQFQRQGAELQAEQQLSFAKGGVLTTSGTPLDLMTYTKDQLDIDRRNILREGFLAESFAKSEAENLRYQGRAARSAGKNAKRGATLGALGTILTGSGMAFGMGGGGLTKTPKTNPTSQATQLRY